MATENHGDFDLTGELLDGRYRVEKKLDGGGMGAVFLARDEGLHGRRVVVKVPHPSFLTTPNFVERFEREIESLVASSHPYIVNVFGKGRVKSIPFMVLQHLAGGSLKGRLGTPLAPVEVLKWLEPIAEALDSIHRKDVVHRDVKPGNILFDETGHAILADFGIVKALAGRNLHLTMSGVSLGSPAYMAPEAARPRNITSRYDQYSLAVVVYEALSGKLPHEGETDHELILEKNEKEPRPLHDLLPGISPLVEAVVMKALAKAPSDRFTTCSEFAQAFRAAAEGKWDAAPSSHSSPPSSNEPWLKKSVTGAQTEGLESEEPSEEVPRIELRSTGGNSVDAKIESVSSPSFPDLPTGRNPFGAKNRKHLDADEQADGGSSEKLSFLRIVGLEEGRIRWSLWFAFLLAMVISDEVCSALYYHRIVFNPVSFMRICASAVAVLLFGRMIRAASIALLLAATAIPCLFALQLRLFENVVFSDFSMITELFVIGGAHLIFFFSFDRALKVLRQSWWVGLLGGTILYLILLVGYTAVLRWFTNDYCFPYFVCFTYWVGPPNVTLRFYIIMTIVATLTWMAMIALVGGWDNRRLATNQLSKCGASLRGRFAVANCAGNVVAGELVCYCYDCYRYHHGFGDYLHRFLEENAAILISSSIIVAAFSIVVIFKFVYRLWATLPEDAARMRRSSAALALCVPILGAWWLFRIVPGFVTAYNRHLKSTASSERELQKWPFVLFALLAMIGFIPIVNLVIYPVWLPLTLYILTIGGRVIDRAEELRPALAPGVLKDHSK